MALFSVEEKNRKKSERGEMLRRYREAMLADGKFILWQYQFFLPSQQFFLEILSFFALFCCVDLKHQTQKCHRNLPQAKHIFLLSF